MDTTEPYRFLTPADEAGWREWANSEGVHQEDRDAAAGGVNEYTSSNWVAPNGDDGPVNPCPEQGSLQQPTPGYAATLPTDAEALLTRLAADSPANEREYLETPLFEVLTWPWLTQEQRTAAVTAIGLLPATWTVSPAEPVAGQQALALSRDHDGVRERWVISGAAPGIWGHTVTVIDQDAAYIDLPAGTVVIDSRISEAAIVPSSTVLPAPGQ